MPVRHWLTWLATALVLLLGLALIAFGILWSRRDVIAAQAIDRALASRGVRAQYRVASIGFRTERIENLIIGDPMRPDLTASSAEVTIGFGLHGPVVKGVRLDHPRLRARIADGRLRLGEVDKLMPAPSGKAFALPDIDVDLNDARVRLDSPFGRFGIALEGQGNLQDGFMGRAAVLAMRVDAAGCTAALVRAVLNLSTGNKRPALDGPISARALFCPGVTVAAPQVALDIRFGEALDRWRGGARVTTPQIGSPQLAARDLVAQLGFDGNRQAVTGEIELSAGAAGNMAASVKTVAFDGRYAARFADRRLTLEGEAEGRAGVNPARLASLARTAAAMSGTPVAPVAAALGRSLAAAARGARFTTRLRLDHRGAAGGVRFPSLAVEADSGARLAISDGGGIGVDWPSGRMRLDGEAVLAGGGLPGARVVLRQRAAGAALAGELTVAPVAANGARLQIDPVRFGPGPAGETRFATQLRIDGQLGTGRIDGLLLPVSGRLDGRGGVRLGEACVPVGFGRLEMAGVVLRNGRSTMCPLGGGAILYRTAGGGFGGGVRTGPVGFAGSIGATPVALGAQALAIPFGTPGFTADRFTVRLGAGEDHTRLTLLRLAGDVQSGGIAGRFEGAEGKLANVPLLISGGRGDWRLSGGALALDATLTVDDTVKPERFHRLAGKAVHLAFADGVITATGALHEPKSDTKVADVDIRHVLRTGEGRAVLAVPGLAFGADLQPEALTPLTLGVVANVEGKVAGQGTISWGPRGVTSGGRFNTTGLNLAAAFGPVRGLAGTIDFSDLLALETPPGQQVTIAEVNPGVAVTDGTLAYQLLPGHLIRIEGGRWPFAGGALTLDPTTLDFAERRERHLTFNVDGLDAAQFIEQLELKNIMLTGKFDGVLPMVFDDRGGRIVGGRLAVRQGGGKLAYVGELSNEQLGMFGKLAFDALKSIRYRSLAIDLNGSLDGEIVSRVSFDGTNEAPKTADRSGWLGQLTGLPFRFRITITAPFRQLMNSATSFNDPRGLIAAQLPQRPAAPAPAAPAAAIPPASVQRHESEAVR